VAQVAHSPCFVYAKEPGSAVVLTRRGLCPEYLQLIAGMRLPVRETGRPVPRPIGFMITMELIRRVCRGHGDASRPLAPGG